MLKKIIKTLFGGGPASRGTDGFFLQVRCDQCAEAFRLFVNKSTDLAQEFDENENIYYKLKKEIIGASCRNRIQVEMIFDGTKNLVSKQIENGSYIDET
jgi:hypothetical protein